MATQVDLGWLGNCFPANKDVRTPTGPRAQESHLHMHVMVTTAYPGTMHVAADWLRGKRRCVVRLLAPKEDHVL